MYSTETNVQLINHDADLVKLCAILAEASSVALDTEFVRRDTYHPKLSIIQIAVDNSIFIIDALTLNLTPLQDILLNTDVLKILHAPLQDFEIFYKLFKIIPENVFDTQLAASFCGFRAAMSYSSLCEEICNAVIDKTYQASNWLIRPLPQEMLDYAAIDVQFLHEIYHALAAKLGTRAEEYNAALCTKLLDPKLYQPNLASAWKKVKFDSRSEVPAIALQMLAAFREEYAALSDLPRGHLISDADLIKMSHVLPVSHRDFKHFSHTKLTASQKHKLFDLCAGIRMTNVKS